MTRDYKKGQRRKRRPRHRGRGFWRLTSLLLIILLMTGLWLKYPFQARTHNKSQQNKQTHRKQPEYPTSPQFDFYTLLPTGFAIKLPHHLKQSTPATPTQRQQHISKAVSAQLAYELKHHPEALDAPTR